QAARRGSGLHAGPADLRDRRRHQQAHPADRPDDPVHVGRRLLTHGQLASDRAAAADFRRGAAPTDAHRATDRAAAARRHGHGGDLDVNAPLRRVGVVTLVLFALLFANLNWVQGYKADAYRTNKYNGRVQIDDYQRQRGTIYDATGKPLAVS